MAFGDLITADGQIEWAGMVFGDGVLTYTDSITGWEDLPNIDSGDVARPSSHGSWAGPKLAQERLVSWNGEWRPPYGASDDGSSLRALRAATSVDDSGNEQPLVVRLLGETLLAYGAVIQRVMPNDQLYGVRAGTLALQWACSDPKRYSLNEASASISLPTAVAIGLVYPLVYPLDYGTPVTPPTGAATNGMEAAAPMRLVFSGPMTAPTLTNLTNGKILSFNIDIGVTDVFEVDTGPGTVLLNGVDRLYTRSFDSGPVRDFLLAPGVNEFELRAQDFDTGAGVQIFWRDATF